MVPRGRAPAFAGAGERKHVLMTAVYCLTSAYSCWTRARAAGASAGVWRLTTRALVSEEVGAARDGAMKEEARASVVRERKCMVVDFGRGWRFEELAELVSG